MLFEVGSLLVMVDMEPALLGNREVITLGSFVRLLTNAAGSVPAEWGEALGLVDNRKDVRKGQIGYVCGSEVGNPKVSSIASGVECKQDNRKFQNDVFLQGLNFRIP